MYRPPAFAFDDEAEIDRLMQRYPFGVLVTEGSDGFPHATHLPMLAQRSESGLRLIGHIARANPQCDAIRGGAPALAVFTGAHAYISPSWYEPLYPQVPTWNYSAVHARGHLREASEPQAILAHLTAHFEASFERPWEFAKLDASFVENQVRGIVAFELLVERIDGKAKLSQNREARDAAGAIAGLRASGEPLDRACAAEMQRFYERRR
uniref:Putative Negative transcriptional regulator n=1 Tax=mine drainage metagenome TaxID=410659 RepID=E6Q7C4_9ZZZZ